MNEITILIADDHQVVRRGLAMVLDLEAGLRIIGEASNGAQAIAEAGRLHPDIALLDLRMPDVDGRTAAREIKRRHPAIRVIILSGAEIGDDVFDALDAGVDGYVPKDVSPEELVYAIRTVAQGNSYIHADITRALLERVGGTARRRDEVRLTPREMEILQHLATSATYQEIGQKLSITEETVRSHAKSILSKMGQPNRTLAVVAGVRLGLIDLEGG